ncbi:RNA-binding S4 domain-containing protein [Iningainema tapete]|uniref:RNA-binding S4 domain-containing protein n=1 Tax=Iningainema tapete BLCC-T55 TaxID=2748662 RepID=A0A8J6XTD2_9CYAN|nr:RNA-binding S4 domain-containing protein [Iningainema tapete]MBD2778099.1 RNA-binding S4 domain-containing protein [Iningainema tapete BLCC-T55]
MKTSNNTIKLDQFLKLVGVAPTGGQAKLMIQGGEVKVNDTQETRRGRQLVSGDRVTVGEQTFEVELNDF